MFGGGASKKNSKEQEKKGYYGFDPSGLQRAATAAKYLDGSPNSKQAFELALKKQDTRHLELKQNTQKIQLQRVQHEQQQRRKTLDHELNVSKKRAEYQVQLELQRDNEKMRKQAQVREEQRKKDEESQIRKQQQRRATVKYQNQLRQKQRQKELKMQMGIQKQINDENQQFMQSLVGGLENQKRETMRMGIATSMSILGQGLTQFVSSPRYIGKTIYYLALLYGSMHCVRLAMGLGLSFMLSKFSKPSLIRQTSRIVTSNPLRIPLIYTRYIWQTIFKRTEKDLLDGVILNPSLQTQLRGISYSVLNRQKNFAPFRNLMFYGPPGTGKTLFAKKLAMKSGMDYCVMTGADLAPLGEGAVLQLHNMFDWAQKTKGNGMIMFIDEADAFLRKRKGGDPISQNLRNCINAFLYRTGSQTDKFMLVLATNAPESLDQAIYDRIDQLVHFDHPQFAERVNLLFLYLLQYCTPPKTAQDKLRFLWKHPRTLITGKKLIKMHQTIDRPFIEQLATDCEGFSGRQIAKMVVSWHDQAFALEEPVIDKQLMKRVLKRFKEQQTSKMNWSIQADQYINAVSGGKESASQSKKSIEKSGQPVPEFQQKVKRYVQ